MRWYVEQDAADAARRLRLEVDAAISRIRNWAHMSAPIATTSTGNDIRRIRLRKFPYILVYVIDDDDDIHVIAFAHVRRSRYWLSRL